MNTMKAVRIHRYGGPDVLTYEEAPIPEPEAGEVRVRVHAAAVNPVDWKVREGYMREMVAYSLPLIPGWDVAGIIDRVGAGVTEFVVGDKVYARPDISRNGAYAEYIVVRANEVAPMPRSLDYVQAAAVPLAALTAWQALFDASPPYSSARLAKGQTVLIHGAAGGVGTFAVQLAKWKGARVIATGSPNNEQFLRTLGADEFIDYNRQRFEDVVHGIDVVFDTVSGETQSRSWRVLKPGGVLVSILDPPSNDAAQAHGARGAWVFVQPSPTQLRQIGQLIDDKVVKPIVADLLPLAQARKAQELSQGGHVRGKIVLNVAGG